MERIVCLVFKVLSLSLAAVSLADGCVVNVQIQPTTGEPLSVLKAGVVQSGEKVFVTCISGRVHVNGKSVGVSDAVFTPFNFTTGDYGCLCGGIASTNITLIKPPKFPSEEKTWTVKEGDTVRVPCLLLNRYLGSGIKYAIEWTSSQGNIHYNDKWSRDGDDLMINNVAIEDTKKQYICQVKVNGLLGSYNSPSYSIKLLSLIKPTLHVQNALATCTSEDGQREGDFCITTTHNSGRSITRCNHGNPVSTMIAGMMDVECKVEQRANGSRSVFISRTSKKLSNRTGTEGLTVKGKLQRDPHNNTVSVEVSFHLTPPTHTQNEDGSRHLYSGTIKWDHSRNTSVSYLVSHFPKPLNNTQN